MAAVISVIATANGKETDGSPAVFSFSRSGDTNTTLSVSYQLFGTAQAGIDYTGNTTGTINFAAGSSTATLSLPALADGALIDPYETIIARINPATNYGITPGKQFATATITAEGMVVNPKAASYPRKSNGEVKNLYAFVALKSDGSVVSWGDSNWGGNAPAGLTGVSQIFSNNAAFAALKNDGSVVSWGLGGSAPAGLTGVSQIFSTDAAFAALKSDGSVFTWGDSNYGGNAPAGLTGVSQISSTRQAFAALKDDGNVVSWSNSPYGSGQPPELIGVKQIFSNKYAFAALKNDGTVEAWGYSNSGGAAPAGLTGVSQIFSTEGEFAALKSDGTVKTWGIDSWNSDGYLGAIPQPAGLTGVSQIFTTATAFAALKIDGSVVSWGRDKWGGSAPAGLTGVSQIFSNERAFAALKDDGNVVTWGETGSGGTAPAGLTGVSQIFSTGGAFAALKTDGSVVTWGNSSYSGSAPAGLTGVSQIFSDGFAALKSDGSVVSWVGGNAAKAPAGLTGVVGFANPFTDDRLIIDATPTYTLTPSATTISEGAVLTSTVTTANVASGTKFYYALSGAGITAADFSAGALTGEGTTDSTGKFSFTHTFANDLATEGAETLNIKLFTDSARNVQVGLTATVSVVDSLTNALPTQSLTLSAPSKTAIRLGISTTSAITYNVSTGGTALTGVGASLYFDSTQLSVAIAGDPFKTGLLGNAITADTSNADGDLKTDKVLSLSYADFGGNFPGSGTTLPLLLANLNLVPTNTFSGSTLHLKGDPAVGFTATGADLKLGYNASPVVNNNLAAFATNRNTPFSYTFKSDLFTDSDSTLSFSATTSAGNTLPSWLTFNPTTRTLSGTPTTGGSINLNLSAADELGNVSTALTLKIREVQSLSSSTTAIRYQRNKELTVPINYSTSDGLSTTGLSFKVHFNSSLLSFDSTTGITNKAQADLFQIGDTQQDTANTDNDATTDSFIPINIASFTGKFPTTEVPIKLADIIFKAVDKPIDSITDFKETFINFTETETASGYGFTATSASLKPPSFSLDVDGDGKITALGDGLMIIRKLFGAAFAGDALTNKAMSPNSTRTTAEIHEFIQQGITTGLLDVDKDGKTTALGDGLMVIRHLFGAAFANEALTNKAISPSSPYFGPPINHTAVAANIDAIKIL